MSKYAEISVVNVGHNPKSEKVIKVYIPAINYTFTLYRDTVSHYGYASYTEKDVMIYDMVYDIVKSVFKKTNPADYDRNDFFTGAVTELQERIDVVLECVMGDNDNDED